MNPPAPLPDPPRWRHAAGRLLRWWKDPLLERMRQAWRDHLGEPMVRSLASCRTESVTWSFTAQRLPWYLRMSSIAIGSDVPVFDTLGGLTDTHWSARRGEHEDGGPLPAATFPAPTPSTSCSAHPVA